LIFEESWRKDRVMSKLAFNDDKSATKDNGEDERDKHLDGLPRVHAPSKVQGQ
jgi:hypothetical protein